MAESPRSIRLKTVVTVEYEVEYDVALRYYRTNDPVEMARVDQENVENDPDTLLFFWDRDDATVTVNTFPVPPE